MEGIPKKEYGLILPKKLKTVTVPEVVIKPLVFKDSDEESDEESPANWMQKTLQKEKYGGARSKHSKAEIEKLMKENPSIYQYDEVYDEIEKKRNEALAAKKVEKVERKPRYVQTLIATAEKRKKENERRLARQVQKEREAEGDEFADKEVFVTSAYKKKLEEMKALEEEEKEQDRLEAIGNVTKQSDLSGFYRHLYEKVVLDVEDENKGKLAPRKKKKEKESKYARQYRKRKVADSSDEEEPPQKNDLGESEAQTVEHEQKPTTSELKPEISTRNDSESGKNNNDIDLPRTDSNECAISTKRDIDNSCEKEDVNGNDHDNNNKENEIVPREKPPKVNIWVKRTVGELFDSALQRYYQRKADRLAALDEEC